MPKKIQPRQPEISTMKKLLTILTLAAFAAAPAAFAATKKEAAPAATPAPKPAATPAAKPAAAAKAMPMYSEVSAIDVAAKSFTHKNKDGKEVKFVLTDKTEIKNGDAAAKFEDIKVGDWVSGSRLKKSETEYEVIKVSKFGPKAEKKAEAPAAKATPAPKKP
jgi:hypothetical protein